MSARPRSARRTPEPAASAPVFAALGDARRLGLLVRLANEGPLSITGLSRDSDVSRQAITKHLDVLQEAGLVRDRRRGRERLFELEESPLGRARRDLDAISARWDEAVARLRAHVED